MTRSGSSGWLTRCSARQKAASSTTPRASDPSVSGAVQPPVSAWEKPKTMQNRPDDASSVPAQSSRGRLAGLLPCMYISAPATATAAKIRLTYSAQRQDRYSVRTPPRMRPTAPPPPATDPKTPNARPRSRGSRKMLIRVPSADGARIAPNAPCRVRAATSMPNEVAAPPSAEDSANPIRPVMKTRLRLYMSPSRPPSSSRLPKASA